MTSFVVRRVLWMIPVLWAAATLVFFFMLVIPGDPAQLLAGEGADPMVLEKVRADWGLDLPWHQRYAGFLWRLAQLDFGWSHVQNRPVFSIIADGVMRTSFLAVAATLLAAAGGIALGIAGAARHGGPVDAGVRIIATAGMSVPTFWLGLILMLVFSSWLGWLPVSGYGQGPTILGLKLPGPAHMVLPSVTLAVFSIGIVARVTRASLIEERAQDYVRAARSRGASGTAALLRHALSNALLPVVTVVGLNFAALLGGAIATETVFNWPGLGTKMIRALNSRDLLVLEGGVIVMTAAFLVVNLVVDLSYAYLDPRTRDS